MACLVPSKSKLAGTNRAGLMERWLITKDGANGPLGSSTTPKTLLMVGLCLQRFPKEGQAHNISVSTDLLRRGSPQVPGLTTVRSLS